MINITLLVACHTVLGKTLYYYRSCFRHEHNIARQCAMFSFFQSTCRTSHIHFHTSSLGGTTKDFFEHTSADINPTALKGAQCWRAPSSVTSSCQSAVRLKIVTVQMARCQVFYDIQGYCSDGSHAYAWPWQSVGSCHVQNI